MCCLRRNVMVNNNSNVRRRWDTDYRWGNRTELMDRSSQPEIKTQKFLIYKFVQDLAAPVHLQLLCAVFAAVPFLYCIVDSCLLLPLWSYCGFKAEKQTEQSTLLSKITTRQPIKRLGFVAEGVFPPIYWFIFRWFGGRGDLRAAVLTVED